jgi:hypothetical protein
VTAEIHWPAAQGSADGKPVSGALAKALAVFRALGVSGDLQNAADVQSLSDLKSYVRHSLQGGG